MHVLDSFSVSHTAVSVCVMMSAPTDSPHAFETPQKHSASCADDDGSPQQLSNNNDVEMLWCMNGVPIPLYGADGEKATTHNDHGELFLKLNWASGWLFKAAGKKIHKRKLEDIPAYNALKKAVADKFGKHTRQCWKVDGTGSPLGEVIDVAIDDSHILSVKSDTRSMYVRFTPDCVDWLRRGICISGAADEDANEPEGAVVAAMSDASDGECSDAAITTAATASAASGPPQHFSIAERRALERDNLAYWDSKQAISATYVDPSSTAKPLKRLFYLRYEHKGKHRKFGHMPDERKLARAKENVLARAMFFKATGTDKGTVDGNENGESKSCDDAVDVNENGESKSCDAADHDNMHDAK